MSRTEDELPPLPDPAETALAVRYLRRIVWVGVLLFVAYSAALYQPNGALSPWGRDSSQSWMVQKVQQLDTERVRAHPGGRVVWLVGSSILRESFDIEVVNAGLAARNSPWRVETFSQGRGAGMLAYGMVKQLPVQPGDLVVHNVALQNLRNDWLTWTGLPAARVSRMLSPADQWALGATSLPERLEQGVAVPWNFYRWHDDVMDGFIRWGLALAWGTTPRKRRPGVFFRYNRMERAAIFRDGVPSWEVERNLLTEENIDFSDAQVNMQGMLRLREWCAEQNVDVRIFNIPPSAYAQTYLETPGVHARWAEWTEAQQDIVFVPQIPDSHYYDRRHPNFRGRDVLSLWLVNWLDGGQPRGERVEPAASDAIAYPWSTPMGGGSVEDDENTEG